MNILYARHISDLLDDVIDLVEQSRKNRHYRHIYIVTPDTRTLMTERRYLEKVPCGSLMKAEVLDLGKLHLRIQEAVASVVPAQLSAQGQALALRKTLQERPQDFPLFSPLSTKAGYLELLRREINQLRRAGLSAEKLHEIALLADEVAKPTGKRLLELARLLAAYGADLAAADLRDPFSDMTQLALCLEEFVRQPDKAPDILREAQFVFLGFVETRDFSAQEYRIIEALRQLAADIQISVLLDVIPFDGTAAERASLAWRPGREAALSLRTRFPEAKWRKSSYDRALPWLENSYLPAQDFGARQLAHESPSDSPITLRQISAPSRQGLYEMAAGYIRHAVNSSELRYRDISLCLCNEAEGMTDLLRVLDDFAIPAYVEREISLAESQIFQECSLFMQVATRSWRAEDLCQLLRRCAEAEWKEEIDFFENYCLAGAVHDYRLRNPKYYPQLRLASWDASVWAETYPDVQQWARQFYHAHIAAIQEACEQFKDLRTVRDALRALQTYLRASGAELRHAALVNALQEEGNPESGSRVAQAWNSLLTFGTELLNLYPDLALTADEFYDIFLHAAESRSAGSVPTLVDEVQVGNPRTLMGQTSRLMLLLEPTDENFPAASNDQAVLSSLDKRIINDVSGLLLPGQRTALASEYALVTYQLLASCTQDLLLCINEKDPPLPNFLKEIYERFREHSSAEEKEGGESLKAKTGILSEHHKFRFFGRQARRNLFLAQLAQREASDQTALYARYLPQLAQSDADLLFLSQLPEDEEKIERFCPEIWDAFEKQPPSSVLFLSYSQLERYQSCPYSYLYQYRLRMRERDVQEANVQRQGSFAHALLEIYMKRLVDRLQKIAPGEEAGLFEDLRRRNNLAQLKQLISSEIKHFQPYEDFFISGHYGMITRPLLQSVQAGLTAMLLDMQREKRRPMACEWTFGMEKAQSFVWQADFVPGGPEAVGLRGCIDRIDVRLDEEKRSKLSLFDYKSSAQTIHYASLWHGLSLQLPIYMLAANQLFGAEAEVESASYFTLERPRYFLPDDGEEGTEGGQEKRLSMKKEELTSFLQHSQTTIEKAAGAIFRNEFPLRPRKNAGRSPCSFCLARNHCPYDYPEFEAAETEKMTEKTFFEKLEAEHAERLTRGFEKRTGGLW